MTTIFIIVIFSVIVIYDILMVILKKEYITTVFRKWYREKNIIPFMVGVVFIGHFQSIVNYSNVPLFLFLSIIYLLWYTIMSGSDIKWSRKYFNLSNRLFFIPMITGAIIGSLWR